MLDAGRLRHRVTLQRRTPPVASDAYAQPREIWEDVATRSAEVVPLAGQEQPFGGGTSGVVTHRVTLRYFPGLSPEWRLLFRGRVLGIEGVINTEEMGVEHVLTCKEGV